MRALGITTLRQQSEFDGARAREAHCPVGAPETPACDVIDSNAPCRLCLSPLALSPSPPSLAFLWLLAKSTEPQPPLEAVAPALLPQHCAQ